MQFSRELSFQKSDAHPADTRYKLGTQRISVLVAPGGHVGLYNHIVDKALGFQLPDAPGVDDAVAFANAFIDAYAEPVTVQRLEHEGYADAVTKQYGATYSEPAAKAAVEAFRPRLTEVGRRTFRTPRAGHVVHAVVYVGDDGVQRLGLFHTVACDAIGWRVASGHTPEAVLAGAARMVSALEHAEGWAAAAPELGLQRDHLTATVLEAEQARAAAAAN